MATAPFVFGRIADRDNFVDREAERERLTGNFRSLVNTVIISPRRWGKSSLVQRVAQDLKGEKDIRVCMIDLFNVRSEADFYAHLARGVMAATMTKWDGWVEAAQRFLGHLRPKVTISPDPTQKVTLDMDWSQAEQDPDEVLDLAEKIAESKKVKVVVCIDEFQAIAGFRDARAFQQKLRSHWQRHQHVCYCLFGSKRHMLLAMFSDPELPFYRFGDVMMLEKIDNAVWGDFVSRRFADTGKELAPELGRHLAALVENHSYYVQQLAQQAWFRTEAAASLETVEVAMDCLTDQLGLLFAGMVDTLTARQLGFLRAVLAGERALSSQRALAAHNLGTSANVARMKEALVNREIIDVTGRSVEILDPVFKHWLATRYFGGLGG